MCLLIFAHQISDHYPLLVAANRDEFHRRPTTASRFWPNQPSLLAGRDDQLGGTWMGVSRDGKFAAVTNFRDPDGVRDAPKSRGELPLQYLLGSCDPEPYLQDVSLRAQQYAGFNLLVGDSHTLWYFSNAPLGDDERPRPPAKLQPGIYGLSNAHLDTPWPKVVTGKKGLTTLLCNEDSITHRALVELVSSADLADPGALQSLGMGSVMELKLSAQFIQSEAYGTRSSTTLWRDRSGQVSWRELSFDNQGQITDTRHEDFRLSTTQPDWE